jgi:hypothetical protein
MIADGRDIGQLRRAPWTSLAPGLAIGLAVLGFNLLGDALRDALDPRAASLRPGRERRRARRRTPRQGDVPTLAGPVRAGRR